MKMRFLTPFLAALALSSAASAACVTGSLSSAATGGTFTPSLTQNGFQVNATAPAQFNISVSGTFSATWQILRSIDSGANYAALSSLGIPYSFTGTMSETFTEPQPNVKYAISIGFYSSGTLNYAICQ
jgi:hypothetical protein